jgi:hypothetical protein
MIKILHNTLHLISLLLPLLLNCITKFSVDFIHFFFINEYRARLTTFRAFILQVPEK